MSDAATESAAIEQAHQAADSRSIFGFWVYLMTDCVLFASLFATYAVLHNSTFGGPSGFDLFSLPYVLAETLILLTSSFTCGLMILAARARRKDWVLLGLVATFLLGAAFLTLELTEFTHLVQDGNSWQRSGFLSSFFTLVGTHGLHITVGLVWMIVMMARISKHGLRGGTLRKLTLLTMFWHFLDIIWIFIFSVVYLLGVIGV